MINERKTWYKLNILDTPPEVKCHTIADLGTPGPVLEVPRPLTLYLSPPPPPMYYLTLVPQVWVQVLHECMQLLYAQNH